MGKAVTFHLKRGLHPSATSPVNAQQALLAIPVVVVHAVNGAMAEMAAAQIQTMVLQIARATQTSAPHLLVLSSL